MLDEIKYFIEDYWKYILGAVIAIILVVVLIFVFKGNKEDSRDSVDNGGIITEEQNSNTGAETEEETKERENGGNKEEEGTPDTNEENTEDSEDENLVEGGRISEVDGEIISDGVLKLDEEGEFLLDENLQSVKNDSETYLGTNLDKYKMYEIDTKGTVDEYYTVYDSVYCESENDSEDAEVNIPFEECASKILPKLKWLDKNDKEVDTIIEALGRTVTTQKHILDSIKENNKGNETDFIKSLEYQLNSQSRLVNKLNELNKPKKEESEANALTDDASWLVSEVNEIKDYNKQFLE